MSPGLEDKLAFTVTATGSYEEAAAVAQKWGCAVEDSTLHALTQKLGQRAEGQTQARLKTAALELAPQRAASEVAVFMLDGWQARHRGPGWGKKKTQQKRVEWHEVKEDQAKEWVEGRLHELRHGQEAKFLAQMAALKVPRGKPGATVREQKNYFAHQATRMNYQTIAQRGWPIGSGAVESACSGQQNRFKRRGQFWTREGLGNLAALKQARENQHWDELWFAE